MSDEIREMVRVMFDEIESRTKEQAAGRAIDDALAGARLRVPWYARLVWGPVPQLVGHTANLIATAALVAIALRLYGVV